MIQKPTTLILGAGASAPYGFPTGYELVRRVLDIPNPSSVRATQNGLDRVLFDLGFGDVDLDKFRLALSKSGKTSVDAFLEHRPEFMDVGKKLMAIALIRCEIEGSLFNPAMDSWYQYLYNQLNTKFEDFDNNRLRIITFNYDRSLEHYLFTALKNSYGKTDAECAAKLNSIPVLHVHGDLGELPLPGKSMARYYENTVNEATVSIAAKRIKIIHEDIANNPQFTNAHQLLDDSHYICFLGFGYHPVNMQRLGFRDTTDYGRANIFGSTHGLTMAECRGIKEKLLFGRLQMNPDATGAEVLKFLRETNILQEANS